MTEKRTPITPNELYELADRFSIELDSAGFTQASLRLRLVLDTAYTTGSEWLGELGLALREISSKNTLPAELKDRLKFILKTINRSGRRSWFF